LVSTHDAHRRCAGCRMFSCESNARLKHRGVGQIGCMPYLWILSLAPVHASRASPSHVHCWLHN
jgi:hypothetical protein